MYFLKNHFHFILITFLLSCFTFIDCNAQVDVTRNTTKSGLNFSTECLMIYPNPADNLIMIKIPNNIPAPEPVLVRIIFLDTKAIVEEIVIDRYRVVDTSYYPNGSYLAVPIIPNQICSGTKFQVFHK